MKRLFVCLAMLAGSALMAQTTVVVRQPGLVEGVCNAAFGAVRCTGEFATGLVAGNSTVVTTPAVTAGTVVTTPGTVVAAPACTIVQQPVVAVPAVPVVVAPATPLVVPYGGYHHYYRPCCGYYRRPYYRPYRPYCRPCCW